MKLRNKKTGEIVDVDFIYPETAEFFYPNFKLVDFNELFEDYEEPIKPYWFINDLDGEPMKCDLKNCGKSNFIKWSEHRNKIGNYFETKEEAEKAVEKLKAWKRLKDKGFRFDCWDNEDRATIHDFVIYCRIKDLDNINKDLDLLFGGEE